ncbi:hypothetical protein ABH994_002314 [Bradyrhizobium yuanmingense]|uniref:hypothetical protein n=1 Tax=Bradyrhizobium yuanmingense TaxID=108015 RepID=UPI003511FC10
MPNSYSKVSFTTFKDYNFLFRWSVADGPPRYVDRRATKTQHLRWRLSARELESSRSGIEQICYHRAKFDWGTTPNDLLLTSYKSKFNTTVGERDGMKAIGQAILDNCHF